jgi:hypothetical protein
MTDEPVEGGVPAGPGRHVHASMTNAAVIERAAFQPTRRREYTSMMKAT